MNGRNAVLIGVLLLGIPTAQAQVAESQSCSGMMTEQLRRFNEQCLSDLVVHVLAQQKATARILSEKSKFYVQLVRTSSGLDAEAVSRANFPFMTDATVSALKALGWMPPDNEEGNFRKRLGTETPARIAEDVASALAAYGLTKGEAISLTVGAQD